MHTSPIADCPAEFRIQSLLPLQSKIAFFLVTALFLSVALPNNLNDALIRQSKAVAIFAPLICCLVVAGYAFWWVQFAGLRPAEFRSGEVHCD